MLQGVSTSPSMEFKMKTDIQDLVYGLDFVCSNIGSQAELWHKYLKHYFTHGEQYPHNHHGSSLINRRQFYN